MIVIEEKELFQTLVRVTYAAHIPPMISGLIVGAVFKTLKVKLDPAKTLEWSKEELKQNPDGNPFLD